MLTSTASLKGEVAPASIFDFSLAEAAVKELAQKKLRIRLTASAWSAENDTGKS
jgi:hypothetical protein